MGPSKLLPNWIKEWGLNVDQDVIDLQLLIGYARQKDCPHPTVGAFIREHDKGTLQCQGIQALGQLQRDAKWHQEEELEFPTANIIKLQELKERPPTAQRDQDRFVILTTPKCFQNHVLNHLTFDSHGSLAGITWALWTN